MTQGPILHASSWCTKKHFRHAKVGRVLTILQHALKSLISSLTFYHPHLLLPSLNQSPLSLPSAYPHSLSLLLFLLEHFEGSSTTYSVLSRKET